MNFLPTSTMIFDMKNNFYTFLPALTRANEACDDRGRSAYEDSWRRRGPIACLMQLGNLKVPYDAIQKICKYAGCNM